MRHVIRASLLAAIGALLSLASPVSADCTTALSIPREPSDARGTTFTGTFVAESVLVHEWNVERAYAGGPLPATLTYTTIPCYGAGPYVAGERYFFSTANIDEPGSGDTLAWRLPGDGSAELVLGGVRRHLWEGELLAIDTLTEAKRAILGELPDTSSATAALRPMAEPTVDIRLLLLAAFLAGAVGWTLVQQRRALRARPDVV